MRRLVALALTLVLAGCSGGAPAEDAALQAQFAGLDGLLSRAPGLSRPAAAPALVVVDGRPTAAPGPLLGVELPMRNATARLAPSGRNGEVTTWRSVDAVSLSLRAPGVLVATRGLGDDLLIADVDATAAALTRGVTGAVQRRHVRLDGNLQQQEVRFACTLTDAGSERITVGGRMRDTRRFDERCEGGAAGSFTNRYWRDAAGPVIWQSEQWGGPELGLLRLQRLGG